jgi:hypothetical protein
MNSIEFNRIIRKSKSKSDVCRKLNYHINGTGLRKVNQLIDEYNSDITHFDRGKSKKTKYVKTKKICPICGTEFETLIGHRKEKTTCSHSCANTYFRTGNNNPNYRDDINLNGIASYKIICFRYHNKKCVCCDEKNIVEVHHYDGNKENNKPENLVPLCPTHHSYWHSRFRYLIREKVDKYIENFKKVNE